MPGILNLLIPHHIRRIIESCRTPGFNIVIKGPHKPHRGTGCKTAYNSHLQSARTTHSDVPSAVPTNHDARLDIAEDKERKHHYSNRHVQACVQIVCAEIGDEWK